MADRFGIFPPHRALQWICPEALASDCKSKLYLILSSRGY